MTDVILPFDCRCADCRVLLTLGTTARRVLGRLLCTDCQPITDAEEVF